MSAEQHSDLAFGGKIAFVTGGGSGLGRQLVRLLSERGATTFVADVDEGAAKAVSAEFDSGPGSAIALQVDVRDEESVRAAYARVEAEANGLDIVLANAGIVGQRVTSTEDVTVEAWDLVMDINLKGVFLTAKHAIPLLKKRGGGSIVATSSLAAIQPLVLGGAYGPSKAGVLALVRGLALELAQYRIRANAVAPGGMNTAFGRSTGDVAGPSRDADETRQWRQLVDSVHPLAPADEPWDVAEVILFLASPLASFVTGQCVSVDGGMGIQPTPNPLHSAPPK